ncbi:MAG: hypothetical protein II661_08415 [Bacteroidales bacterium]|nr:hypothetical protein [Bacteroidales bacterium]
MKNPNTQRKKYVRINNSHFLDVAVVAISLKDNTIKIYQSMSEAVKEGFTKSAICSCCRGSRNKHKGYK